MAGILNSFGQALAAYIAPIVEEVVIDALEPFEHTPPAFSIIHPSFVFLGRQ
jgi:hypothetical protein